MARMGFTGREGPRVRTDRRGQTALPAIGQGGTVTENMERLQDRFSRRDFLGRLATGSTAAALSLADTRAAFARTLESVRNAGADGPEAGGYWEKVRKQFILEEGFAYLNTGTLGPTPRSILEAMNEYWRLM